MVTVGRIQRDALLLGIRTAWANPEDIAKKLLAITQDDLMSGKGGEIGRSIAASAPDSLFAQDLKAGVGGVIGLAAAGGIVAAVTVPALMKYMQHTKQPEAELH